MFLNIWNFQVAACIFAPHEFRMDLEFRMKGIVYYTNVCLVTPLNLESKSKLPRGSLLWKYYGKKSQSACSLFFYQHFSQKVHHKPNGCSDFEEAAFNIEYQNKLINYLNLLHSFSKMSSAVEKANRFGKTFIHIE